MSNSVSREVLLRVATLVRPAVCTKDYVPILKNIYFDGMSACAYNDETAITVRCPAELDCCIPGDMLIKTLNSFTAAEVLTTQANNHVLLASGRSKIKIPFLPSVDFPFDHKGGNAIEIELTRNIRKGISRCLISVSNDPTHPAQMGVTIEQGHEGAALYSTDNATLSSYHTADKIKLPGGIPIILPTFFCQQLLSLAEAFPEDRIDLLLYNGAAVAKFGDSAELFTKLVVDLEPLDIGKVMNKYTNDRHMGFQAIPESFDAALDRALLVLANEQDKATTIYAKDGRMTLHSQSDLGEATDSLPYREDADEFFADPVLISRGAKVADKILLASKVIIMSGETGQFTHIIAHCTK